MTGIDEESGERVEKQQPKDEVRKLVTKKADLLKAGFTHRLRNQRLFSSTTEETTEADSDVAVLEFTISAFNFRCTN
jgi:hypothetical protein